MNAAETRTFRGTEIFAATVSPPVRSFESLGEGLPVVYLDADHEAGTGETRHVVPDAGVAVALQEGLEVGRGRIVAQYSADRFQLRTLPGGGRPVREKQHLLGRVAGQAVADRALVERDQVGVASCDPVERILPFHRSERA